MLRRQRFEVNEGRRVGSPSLEGDASNAVEECAVFQLGQALFARPGASVEIIARIRLCNVSHPVRVYGQSVEQGSQCVDGLDELVGCCIEHEQVAIRHLGILDDVHDVAQGKHVVCGDGVVPGVERHEVAVGLACAAGKLRLVSGLERDHVKHPRAHQNRPRVLRGNIQSLDHGAPGHVDHRDLVLGGQRNVSLSVVGEGDAHRLIKARRLGG